MAYNLSSRFPENKKCFRIFDPGAYNCNGERPFGDNKAPFLSNTSRNSGPRGILWTHAIYNIDYPPKIPNVTSLKSKIPRFSYEAFKIEDFEKLLCQCGISPCECPVEEEKKEIVCQGKTARHLYKGHVPFSVLSNGLSVPPHNHLGFEPLPDGRNIKIPPPDYSGGPPIYDATVNEATAFYRGCKWSQWKSKRSPTSAAEKRPGPADYTLESTLTEDQRCQEIIRSYKRQTSRQPRYIEIIQQRNYQQGQPGPAHYSPELPKGTNLQYLGPKADRFIDMGTISPAPNVHNIKRDFDLPEKPKRHCYARLPSPAPFGIKAKRFRHKPDLGPSPASYDPRVKLCRVLRCTTAGFSSSAKRFKEDIIESSDDDEGTPIIEDDDNKTKECPNLTSSFKSRTIRFEPLLIKEDEPSPADLPQQNNDIDRHRQLQYMAPFFSSEGRFLTWYNDVPIKGKENTPGPGVLNLEKPKCYPAVNRGPMFRTQRFPPQSFLSPAPNEYKIKGSLDTVLNTCNTKLKSNIKNQHTFIWKYKPDPPPLSLKQKEMDIFRKSIGLLDMDDIKVIKKKKLLEKDKPKMLRWFLYNHQMRNC